MERYVGSYKRFETVDKKEAGYLVGSDSLIGDYFEITFDNEDGAQRAWLVNKFGQKVAYFEKDISRELAVIQARGWVLVTTLSYVVFTDSPQPGKYWGEAAIMAYDPSVADEFKTFTSNMLNIMKDGVRPDISLSPQAIDAVIKNKGNWAPNKTIDIPKMNHGSALVKSRRTMSEKLIEKGRKGKIGCYIVSWIFNIGLLAGVVLLILYLVGVI